MNRSAAPRVERLDARQLLAAAPSVVMLSATTLDSKGVTISYDVETPRTAPITLGVYRSTDATLSGDDTPVEGVVVLPAVDSSGAATTSLGDHTVTVPIPGGLPLNPSHPYVLAVANPVAGQADDAPSTASFRTHTIAVITHGGIQDTAWKKNGPPWTLQMAKSLLAEGYDTVIHYNWVSQSSSPGKAAQQGPKLAAQVLAASSKFPSTDPVDIQFIGHSEGAVVNTQAIVDAAARQTPQLKAGFWEDTLLDPHAANPDTPGQQYSVNHGILGAIAKGVIDNYQARARDPLVFVPPRIDSSQVFYQQTPANRDHNENGGIYNLWGEVPVEGADTYFNLTPSGIVHGGNNGVYAWYQLHVVPLLGDGAPGLDHAALNGAQIVAPPAAPTSTTTTSSTTSPSATPVAPVVDAYEPTFTGTAQPGATVVIRVSRTLDAPLRAVATTTAAADGTWTATVRNLAAGKYRVVAAANVLGPIAGKRPVVATEPLGDVVIPATYNR